MTATLYIVATPIGNLEDITYRAVRILSEVDIIAAEDTRHTLKLLNHFGISKTLTSYYDHNQKFKGDQILFKLQSGKSVALVSDAGTPCISDPGYNLVKDALENGIRVVPIPGACAAISALSASGLPSDVFTFAGFLPSRMGKRRSFLEVYKSLSGTLILYEAPHRLLNTLSDILFVMGNRKIVVAREVSKIYEEFFSGMINEVIDHFISSTIKGEVVILVSPGATLSVESVNFEDLLTKLLSEGMSLKNSVQQVAEITGKQKSVVYKVALSLKNTSII